MLDATVGSSGRPNSQPPAGWLVEQAVLLGGWLAGNVVPARVWLRVDAVQVPRASVPALLGAVDTAWPAPPRTVVVPTDEASR